MTRPQEDHADLGEHYGEPVTDYFKPRRTPDATKPSVSPAKKTTEGSEPTTP